jgi:hypothetical protein
LSSPWLILIPIPAAVWWFFDFPPGWGWLVLPALPGQPVSLGILLTLVAVVVGLYSGLVWVRSNF